MARNGNEHVWKTGLSKLRVFQHSHQMATSVKLDKLRSLADSSDGKYTSSCSSIWLDSGLGWPQNFFTEVPFHPGKHTDNIMLEGHRGDMYATRFRKSSDYHFSEWPPLVLSQEWQSDERPVCCEIRTTVWYGNHLGLREEEEEGRIWR